MKANDVDVNARGERSGSLDKYGDPARPETVRAALRAWGALKAFLVNPTGLTLNDGVPVVTREGGPKYMLLFPDGKWRYAAFGGINGPPGFYCQADGYEAPNGDSAYWMRELVLLIRRRQLCEEEVKRAQDAVAAVKQRIAERMATPARADRPVA